MLYLKIAWGRDVTKCDDRPTQVPFVVQNGAAMIDLALEPFQFPGQQLFRWSVKERKLQSPALQSISFKVCVLYVPVFGGGFNSRASRNDQHFLQIERAMGDPPS